MAGKYDSLKHGELVKLLEARDRKRKLGLVWEREEIEADRRQNADFVAMEIVPELSDRPSPWANLVIEADNYDALRWLRMTHKGQVKCIYIDPPYNTGAKDWVYNDHYASADNAYFHSTWLEFLYQRLTIARDLLAEDGVILVSINDEQRARLELLMDEALPGMRVGTFVWRTKDSSNDADRNYSSVHEHVLAYAKPGFSFLGHKLDDAKYRHDDLDGRGRYTLNPITKAHDYLERSNTYYPIQDPDTGWWYPCSPDSVWRFATEERLKDGQKLRTETIESFIRDRRIHFSAKTFMQFDTMEELERAIVEKRGPVDGNGRQLLRLDLPDLDFWVGRKIGVGRPSKKAYWKEKDVTVKPVSSFILGTKDAIDTDMFELVSEKQGKATGVIQDIFGRRAFQNAKPVSLIRSLLAAAAPGDATVLDFFAGSATTAHAVMEMNAEDGGERRFIMVSSTEATKEMPDRNVCRDLTAERIRLLNHSRDERFSELSAGFAYLRTRKIAFEDLDYDLEPAQIWIALQAMHDLPLMEYDEVKPWNVHETDALVLVFATRPNPDFMPWLEALGPRNVLIYSDAPGQLAHEIGERNIEILPARETLVRRFRK